YGIACRGHGRPVQPSGMLTAQLVIPAAVVHLGYHKTATTWLQKQLFPRATSHEFIPRKTVQQAFLAPSGMHFDAEEARRVLGLDNRNRPVLLSEENLSGYLHNGGLHGF